MILNGKGSKFQFNFSPNFFSTFPLFSIVSFQTEPVFRLVNLEKNELRSIKVHRPTLKTHFEISHKRYESFIHLRMIFFREAPREIFSIGRDDVRKRSIRSPPCFIDPKVDPRADLYVFCSFSFCLHGIIDCPIDKKTQKNCKSP